MTNRSSAYRLAAALLAVVFGLTWGAPIIQATCAPTGAGSADHCGDTDPAEHCEGMQEVGVAVCAMHHASQDLRTTRDVEPSFPGVEGSTKSSRLVRTASTTSILFSRRAVLHADRRHARVGVWLE